MKRIIFAANFNFFKLLTIFLCTISISACSQSPDALIVSAKDYILKKDNKTALIQIKNALQINPKLPEGRFLLGSSLLEEGDSIGAEMEFRKALELKYSEDLVIPLLAKAVLAQGNAKKLIDEFGQKLLKDPSAKASLLMSLTAAYGLQGDHEQSKISHDTALQVDPSNASARLLIARKKAIDGDSEAALIMVEKIIAENIGNFDALKLKGDILSIDKNQSKEALSAFRKAIEIKPDSLPAHTTLIALLFQLKDHPAAEAQINKLRRIFPNHPQTKLFEGQLAFHNRDFKSAKEFTQQVLRVAPLNIQALQLAGVVEFQLGSFSLAEGYLAQVVKLAPDLVLPRRVLIQAYLRSGQSEKALSALKYLIDKDSLEPEMLSLAGEVFLLNGDNKSAELYFSKATVISPNDARKKTALALTHLMSGQVDVAVDELKTISNLDTGSSADLALFNFYMNRKEFDMAMVIVSTLDKKMPGKPLPAQLRGRALLAKNDLAGASKSFERALAIDPSFFPAISNLAALDLLGNRVAQAKLRFETYLSKSPKNVAAWLELAELELKSGSSKEEVSNLLTKAVSVNPEDVSVRLFLISFYLQFKDVKAAVNAAQNAISAMPTSSALLDALGRTQMASGEFNQALMTFQKLSAQQVNSHLPHMRMADVYAAMKNKEATLLSLKRTLELKPDFRPALRNLILIAASDKNYTQALTTARLIQEQAPKDEEGYALEADIFAVQKKWPEALTALQTGLKNNKSSALAIKLYSYTSESGKTAEAEKFSIRWQSENPMDSVFLLYLGDVALSKNDLIAAEKVYLSLVNQKSKNALAHNNLAWVLDKLNKPGALVHAEKANALLPNQPAFMDTLSQIYANTGSIEKAVDLQTKVIASEPKNMAFKLNLAKIYIKGGKKDLARKQLEELRSFGNSFPAQAEVADLLGRV